MSIMFDYTLRGRICVPDGSKLNEHETGIILPDGRELKLWEQAEVRTGEDDYEHYSCDEAHRLNVFWDGDCPRFEGPVEDGDRVWPPTGEDGADVLLDLAREAGDERISLIDEPVTGVPIGPPDDRIPVLNADELYEIFTRAAGAAFDDGDGESRKQLNIAADNLEPFAMGYLATALAEHQNR